MSRRLTETERSEIKNDHRPIRTIANSYGISPSTVQRCKKETVTENASCRSKGRPGLSEFEKVVFIEMTKLSRYRFQFLFEYLAPVWDSLPSQERVDEQSENQRMKSGRLAKRVWSRATFRRLLQNYPHPPLLKKSLGGLLPHCADSKSERGLVAIHCVTVEWQDDKEGIFRGDIVLVMERCSGLLYAKFYSGSADNNCLMVCVRRFENILMDIKKTFEIEELRFVVTEELAEQFSQHKRTIRRTSAFQFRATQDKDEEFAAEVFAYWSDDFEFSFRIRRDEPVLYQQKRLTIPGTFQSRDDFDSYLDGLVNSINMKSRSYYFYGKEIKVAPLDLLWRDTFMIKRKKIEKAIKLPRKFKNEWLQDGEE